MKSRSTTSHDVVIIGASLAGSTAASLLGSRGLRCALIDRHEFPRQKACGGGLSRLALPYLQALGIEPHQIAPAQAEFFGFRFSSPDAVHSFEARSPYGRGWGVSRAHLDTLLLQRVYANTSVDLFLREPVRSLHKVGKNWEVHCRDILCSAPYILFAGGSCIPSTIAPYLRQARPPSHRLGYSILTSTRKEVERRFVSIVVHPSGEVYTTPLGSNYFNMSFVGTPQFIQQQRAARVSTIPCAASPDLELEAVEQIGGAGYFQSQHRSSDPSLYLAGDAQESFDPACGLGMLHAIISGFHAASSIESALYGKTSPLQVAREYERTHAATACRIRKSSSIIFSLLHLYRIAPRAFNFLGATSAGFLLEQFERLTVGDLATAASGAHMRTCTSLSIGQRRVVEKV